MTPDRPPRPEDEGAEGVGAARRSRDPFAAALANASLLSAGYLMLGRRRLAAGTASVTVVLVLILASGAQTTWVRGAVVAWWAALTVHGWRLAGGQLRRSRQLAPAPSTPGRPRGMWRQRLIAAAAVAPVLVAFVALRVDASGIEREADRAHREGDCAQALSVLEGAWPGHRVADARMMDRAEASTEACTLLLEAEDQARNDRLAAERTLETYEAHPAAQWEGARGRRAELVLAEASEALDRAARNGSTGSLSTGFGHLSTVLADFPDREGDAGQILDAFLAGLPTRDGCDTRDIAEWLENRPAGGDILDRAAGVVPRIEPAAIIDCGDEAMAEHAWEQARERYQQLLDQYPGHERVPEAQEGITQATQEIELERLRGLLEGGGSGGQPAYCDDPAPYSGAAPYRGDGPHPALHFGEPDHESELPDAWLADDAAEAVLVICVGNSEFGSAVETCPYESGTGRGGYTDVTFHTMRYPVRVYEVRTGRRVDTTRLEVRGTSCPRLLTYDYYGPIDPGPPSDDYVAPSPPDIRAAYDSLINP